MILKMVEWSRMRNPGHPRALAQRHRIRALGSDQFVHRFKQSLPQFPVVILFPQVEF
jgi:hypothetical protein